MSYEVYGLYKGGEKRVEKVISDENVHYLHMVLGDGDAMPEHYANSNVYMTVVRGVLSIGLDGEDREYGGGTLLKIPQNTKMLIENRRCEPLELIIVKVPAPKA